MSFYVTEKHLEAAYVEEWRRTHVAFSKWASLTIVGLGCALFLAFMATIGLERTANYERDNQEILTMRGSFDG